MCQRKTYLYSCAHRELQVRPCPSKCWSSGRRPAVEPGHVFILRDAAAASPSQSLELDSVSVSSSSLLQQHQQRQLLDDSSSAARGSGVVDGSSDGAGAGAAARARPRARATAPTADVVRRIGLCEDCEDVEARVDAVLKREKREKKERRKRRAFRMLGLNMDEVRKARDDVVSRARARVTRLGKAATAFGLFRDGRQ